MIDPSHPNPLLLQATSLEKLYPDGQVHALRGVSLSVQAGEFIAIVGPSGCGKSTFLQILAGLDRPTRGIVEFRGKNLDSIDRDAYRARELGFVFQSFHLLNTLSALENVQIPMFEAPFPRAERLERASRLVEEVGLSHRKHHRPSSLSVGERQRVAIARALANDPGLLLADEPTGNLDSHSQREILDLLSELQIRRGLTLIIITHSPEVAASANRVLHMRDGVLVNP